MIKKHYSKKIQDLAFGMMVEIPQGCGRPKVEQEYVVETVIHSMGEWVITKTGRILATKYDDRFVPAAGFSANDPPCEYIFVPAEGERTYWNICFALEVKVPETGERFRTLVDYKYSEKILIPKLTAIEYLYTYMKPYANERHENLIRVYQTTNQEKLQITFYALGIDQFIRPTR